MAELVCGTGDRDTWLAARREGITATDLPTILGLVTWDSPFALYWRKKGLLSEVKQSDRMRLGSWLEMRIVAEWYHCHGMMDVDMPAPKDSLFRSSVRPWQLATPDVAMIDAVLECKTSATRDSWGDGHAHNCQDIPGDPENPVYHDPECSKVPAHVRAQVLWQMDTLGVPVGHVAVVFLPSGEFRSYTLSHDERLDPWPHDAAHVNCAICRDIALMRDAGAQFWYRLRDDDPPPVDGLAVTTDALRHLHAGAVKGKIGWIDDDLAEDYECACDDLSLAKERKIELENRIRQELGDATVAVISSERKIARREVFKRAGYEVPPAEVDRLVRVKPKEDKTDETND